MQSNKQEYKDQKDTTFPYASNILNKTSVTWDLKRCIYAETYKLLTGKDLDPCGHSTRPSESCDKCQKLPRYFIRLEWTRECSSVDVNALRQKGQFLLIHFLFPMEID